MDFFSVLALILLLIMQVSVTINILLYKSDIRSSIGWIGLVWFSPVVGTVIYILFGINRIKRKAASLINTGPGILILDENNLKEVYKRTPSNLLQLLRLGYHIHPQYFALDNNLTPLINGDGAYPEMCAAICQAREEVLIQSYIFNNDKAGKAILAAAGQAAQNGAKVKILIDGVGKNYSAPNILKEAKKYPLIEAAVFLPSKKPAALPFVNLRNHRKIMIIDSKTAFFGGMNISADNLLNNNPKNPVADITFKVQGPVIDQLAQIFAEDWNFARHTCFKPKPFSGNLKSGDIPCRVISDGPDKDMGKISSMLSGALACAQKNVQIITPYFLPEEIILSSLETAALRGVQIEIILPSKSNIFAMDWAMRANFERLIKRGVKIYLAHPPFDHSKIVLVDNVWVFIGSANWDERSLRLNFEVAMECINPSLGKEIKNIIEKKKENSILAHSKKMPFFEKLKNNACRLLTPYY